MANNDFDELKTGDFYELCENLVDSDGELKVRVKTGQHATCLVNDENKGKVAMPDYDTIAGFEIDEILVELHDPRISGSCFYPGCGAHSMRNAKVVMPLGAIGCQRHADDAGRDEKDQMSVSVAEAMFRVMQAEQLLPFLQDPEVGRSMEEMQDLAAEIAEDCGLTYDMKYVKRKNGKNGKKGRRNGTILVPDMDTARFEDEDAAFEIASKFADDGIPFSKSGKGYKVGTVGKGKDARYVLLSNRNANFCWAHAGLMVTTLPKALAYHFEGHKFRVAMEERKAEKEERKRKMRPIMEEEFYSMSRAELFSGLLAYILDAEEGSEDFDKFWTSYERDGRTFYKLRWRPLVEEIYRIEKEQEIGLISDGVRFTSEQLDQFEQGRDRCPYALIPVWFRVKRELRYAICSWANAVALAELLTQNGQKDKRRNRDTNKLEECEVQCFPLDTALPFQKRNYDSIVETQQKSREGIKQFRARRAAKQEKALGQQEERFNKKKGKKRGGRKTSRQNVKQGLQAFRQQYGRD